MKKKKTRQIIKTVKVRQTVRQKDKQTDSSIQLEVQQIIQTDKIQINKTNRFDKLTI